MRHLWSSWLNVINFRFLFFCFVSLRFTESARQQPAKSTRMVATSTRKTKSGDCVWEPVERRYDPACIEKGELTCRALPVPLLRFGASVRREAESGHGQPSPGG